uniref:C2 domain-containing protein n=1 Tax=Cyanoderma ruficeps TaxID=181631 RepID=A0A8C3QSJ6_9PASS
IFREWKYFSGACLSLCAAVSKADCYVELKLPTASPSVSRTQVVDNSENPEWNETFQYRIHSAVKNILELTLYDKDVLVSDELTSIVFDLGGMRPGQPLLRTFSLNPEVSLGCSSSLHGSGSACCFIFLCGRGQKGKNQSSVEDKDSKDLRVQAAEIRNGKKPKASCRSCCRDDVAVVFEPQEVFSLINRVMDLRDNSHFCALASSNIDVSGCIGHVQERRNI